MAELTGRPTYDLSLGGEYVHTNIYHFHRSLGSFADPRTNFDFILQETIDKQEQRERRINEQFTRAGIDRGIDGFVEEMRTFQNIVNNVWKIGEVTRAAYLPKQFEQWSPAALQYQAQILKDYLDSLTQFHNNAMEIGGYKIEDVERFMPGFTKLRGELQKAIKGYEDIQTTGGDIGRQIAGMVNYFKGLGYEGVIGSATAGILAGFQELRSQQVEVGLTGMVQRADGRQVKVDVLPKLEDWGVSFGISVKATRQKTLEARWGATLHSGNVRSIAQLIEDTRMGDPHLGDQFKYFLINLSRMRDYAQAYGKEVRGPSKITDYPEYYKLTQEIAKTYATFFVGAELPGRTADVEIPELFNVDIFVLGDRIYKKSELLRQIQTGEMDVKFKLKEYLSQPQSFWENYDIKKREAMTQVGGDYSQVVGQDFVTDAVRKLLPQKAAITLHAVVGK